MTPSPADIASVCTLYFTGQRSSRPRLSNWPSALRALSVSFGGGGRSSAARGGSGRAGLLELRRAAACSSTTYETRTASAPYRVNTSEQACVDYGFRPGAGQTLVVLLVDREIPHHIIHTECGLLVAKLP